MNEYTFEDLRVGMGCEFKHKFTISSMEKFSEISGDNNPLHMNHNFATEHGFVGRIVFGMQTASLLSKLGGMYLPGKNCLIQGVEVMFTRPVYPEDEITVKGKIVEMFDSVRQVVIRVDMYNQSNEKVLRGKLKVGVIDE